MALQPTDRLDARGLACPLPLLKAKQALAALSAGDTLFVVASDPGSWRDFESFAAGSAHELLQRDECNAEYHYLIRKGGASA